MLKAVWVSAVLLLSGVASAAPPALPQNPSWHVQLNGPLLKPERKVYDVDLYDTPKATIAALKSQGRVVICYFSAGTHEDWRPDAGAFLKKVLGKPLGDWPGERWLDVRSVDVRNIMIKRMDLAKSKGCDGVDPDNVDGYSNDNGLKLSAANQLDYNRFLAKAAHDRGLLIGLKNAVDLLPALSSQFDFAINESCYKYNECDGYKLMRSQGKPVFIIDYRAYSSTLCTRAKASGFNLQFYTRSLTKVGTACT